jgi:hypothetical protein
MEIKPVILTTCLGIAVTLSGCVQSIAVSTVGGLVDEGYGAFTEEDDLAFAESSLPGNLKLIEVLLKSEPENERLLRLASQGYASYALAFVEDTDPERARAFYLRGRDYGLRILRQDEELARAIEDSPDRLRTVLASRPKDLVPAVFWTAFGWGGYVQLALTSPDALADIPRVEAMMEFVAERDSAFYYGGAHIFLGTIAGMRPRLLGGDPERSRSHFETALRLNGGAFLMTYVYYAKSYAVQTLDEELFVSLLETVRDAPLEILPENRLANNVAKRKARQLLARRPELF